MRGVDCNLDWRSKWRGSGGSTYRLLFLRNGIRGKTGNENKQAGKTHGALGNKHSL
jgi:hypothetical protein